MKNIILDFGCHIVSEVLEECNTLLEESLKRKMYWQIKDHGQKNIMSTIGMLSFTHTRFKNKETKETEYLLDRILGFEPHIRMSDGVKASLLEEAVQTSYEKAGQMVCPEEQGIRKRIKKEEGVIGSSTEGHISHVLSSRLSSRPKGWCREGADKITQLRIYWKNGGNMLEIVRWQKEEKVTEKKRKYITGKNIF